MDFNKIEKTCKVIPVGAVEHLLYQAKQSFKCVRLIHKKHATIYEMIPQGN